MEQELEFVWVVDAEMAEVYPTERATALLRLPHATSRRAALLLLLEILWVEQADTLEAIEQTVRHLQNA